MPYHVGGSIRLPSSGPALCRASADPLHVDPGKHMLAHCPQPNDPQLSSAELLYMSFPRTGAFIALLTAM